MCFPQLEENDIQIILKPISNLGIKNSIFSMGALKALGPNGLHALFFQNQWDVVEDLFCSEICKIFETPEKIQKFHETL